MIGNIDTNGVRPGRVVPCDCNIYKENNIGAYAVLRIARWQAGGWTNNEKVKNAALAKRMLNVESPPESISISRFDDVRRLLSHSIHRGLQMRGRY